MDTTLDLTKIKSPGSELSCVYREMFQIDQKDRYGGKVELYPEIHLDTVEITRRQDEKNYLNALKGKTLQIIGESRTKAEPALDRNGGLSGDILDNF